MNPTTDNVIQCASLIREAKSIVALTGAGISTSAGIPDFRGPKGLYVTRQYDPDKVFDVEHFYRDQRDFFEFARDYCQLEDRISPSPAHFFLAKLEEQGKLKGIITQNIDCLHERAGSKQVIELHGSIWHSYCLDCRKEFSFEQMKAKIASEDVPHCECGGVIKPDIVFFGEDVKGMAEAGLLAKAADLFFVIGSSCVVYPAAMIPTMTMGKIVIVNKGRVDLLSGDVVLEVDEDIDAFFKEVERCLEREQ